MHIGYTEDGTFLVAIKKGEEFTYEETVSLIELLRTWGVLEEDPRAEGQLDRCLQYAKELQHEKDFPN